KGVESLLQESFFAALAEVPHPVVVLDMEGGCLYKNDDFLETIGDVQKLESAVPWNMRSAFSQQFRKSLHNRRKFTISTSMLTITHGKTNVTVSAKPRTNHDRLSEWTATVTMDSSTTDHVESDYLDHVSHELRTPLHGILGMLELLRATKLDAEQMECLDHLQYSADTMHQIVNHLLEIPKLQCGMLELENKPFSLYELTKELTQTSRYGVKGKDVHLELQYHVAGGTRTFLGDGFRIRQILGNLLSNAVKFTDSGSIVLRVESEVLISGGQELSIFIVDTGRGIPEDALSRIFDAFTQFDKDARRRYSGTGLGLYYAYKMSEVMGGHVGVTSTLGHGSTFRFVVKLLPFDELLHKSERTEGRTVKTNEEGQVNGKMVAGNGELLTQHICRILIAEDNIINQKVLARMLDRIGLSHTVASNGDEAVKLAQAKAFDAVFMDCDMPVVDGFEATMAIRSSSSNLCASIPIIAVTASGGDNIKKRCLESGMNDVLIKPVNQNDISKALHKWLPRMDWNN
ncbi:hypothetical protein HK097_010643, partial [Rhizophlyctis rosea]